jgi:DNA polymerase-3 subunit gamma/tau
MATLNLTRKFRVLNFEEVVGQSLVIRMLKNSLYIDRLFPVYLFFGQHGCGKTSIARIFGMAINCKALPLFRMSPKQQPLPCLQCDSCFAMQKNSLLDFIEIDAASYTGVDNIRGIIESASYLPVIGSKKIYLIDEAHMLSKAAFNALLKILEEPPANVIFMLATTDVDKIIETVRSRCFQLALQPISAHDINNRLISIANSESIVYDQEALWAISGEANGSVRDALNLVERIRCAYPKVTVDALYQVLGKVPDQFMGKLLIALHEKNNSLVITLLSSESFMYASPTIIWRHIFQLLRAVWYAQQGVTIDTGIDKGVVQDIKKQCSSSFIGSTISFLYQHELHFLHTQAPRFFIEHIFILIAMRATNDDREHVNDPIPLKEHSTVMLSKNTQSDNTQIKQPFKNEELTKTISKVEAEGSKNSLSSFEQFVREIQSVVTPMVHSLFNQATFTQAEHKVIISLPQSAILLNELLHKAEPLWLPIFKAIFGENAQHLYQFTEQISCEKIKNLPLINQKKKNDSTDFSDKEQWPQVHLILKHFPGIITFIEQ